jgi:RNA polymerase sigma-70 factor, ECF subfamily
LPGSPEIELTRYRLSASLRQVRHLRKMPSPLRKVDVMDDSPNEYVTQLMVRASGGEQQAAAQLLPMVYDQLKHLAQLRMAGERQDHTLQPTALVHEAYLKLVGGQDVLWENRAQFFFAAAQAMRRILVDHARARGNLKRGGGRKRLPASVIDLSVTEQSDDILALDEALTRLEGISPGVGQVVRLRFFGGLSIEETASALGVSPRTIKRDWTYARAWLSRELGEPG